MSTLEEGKALIVAAVVATEVPPPGTSALNDAQVALARQAVCNVIRARATSPTFPNDPVLVVLQPLQFSAVCREDYWRKALAGQWFPEHVLACLQEWNNLPPSPVAAGATYYYSPVSMQPPGRVPAWVAGKTEVLVPGLPRYFFRFYS